MSVVVPVYNNQESLTQLASEITSEFSGYKDFELDLCFHR